MCYNRAMKTRDELQTMATTYKEICQGKSPWIPLGMFMHDFFGNFRHHRWQLVRDPIELPAAPTLEQQQWAAFCAASVEYLCERYGVRRPAWTRNPAYTLSEKWYNDGCADLPEVRESLEIETPEAFRRHNIRCSSRIYANKYEIAEDLAQRRRSATATAPQLAARSN
jgi:hypothetical protein